MCHKEADFSLHCIPLILMIGQAVGSIAKRVTLTVNPQQQDQLMVEYKPELMDDIIEVKRDLTRSLEWGQHICSTSSNLFSTR